MAAAAERRGPGLIRSLAGALLLGAIGFGLGLGVGASWEDPDLLVTALAGERRSLELPEPTPETRVAAPPPLGARDPEAAPAAVSAPPADSSTDSSAGSAAPAAAPPEPSAADEASAPPRGSAAEPAAAAGFSVQVGAFSDRSAAGGLEQRLEQGGLPTFVTGAASEGPQRWRVRVGPVPTREEAERLAGRLKREHGLPTWVVAHDD